MSFVALDKFEAKFDTKNAAPSRPSFQRQKIAKHHNHDVTKTRRSEECLPLGLSHVANWITKDTCCTTTHQCSVLKPATARRSISGIFGYKFASFRLVFSNQSLDDVKHSNPLQFSKDITAFHWSNDNFLYTSSCCFAHLQKPSCNHASQMKKTLSKNVNSIKINKHVILVTKNTNLCHYKVL